MKTEKVIHRAQSRGFADHGWLKSHHTFSFAGYFNPARMHFGALRVLNDDVIDGGRGFDTHPHSNMEIVSVPLSGALKHRDSMGHEQILKEGEIQIMSAGKGIQHSEYNANEDDLAALLQIWVLPAKENITPRYEQKEFRYWEKKNTFTNIVSPKEENGALWINQDAYFFLSAIENGKSLEYQLKNSSNNGVYFFVIEGELEINEEKLNTRDAMGLSGISAVSLNAKSDVKLLTIEVPMLEL